jgi:putative ABC transport system permease protein
MLNNFLKIAIRNIARFKFFSFINIFGLAVGIAACIIILLFVEDELSYDKQNENAGEIYRVHTTGKLMGNDINMAISPPPLGETLVNDFPEVVQYTKLMYNPNMLLRYKDKVFNETKFFWADSNLSKVFTIPFIKGDPNTALRQPHTIILTETSAKKYFGNENPMDKIMNIEGGSPYTIRGVIKDCPVNSHFHYDMFASMSSLNLGNNNQWIYNNFYTYILLKKGASASGLQSKLPEFAKKYAGPQLQQLLGISFDEAQKQGYLYQFNMQPLTDIHLTSHLDYEIEANSDIKYVYLFSIVAAFILLIACINFMNLTTARSSTRSKEVGIRKVLGSSKSKLINQFLAESLLTTFFAVVIAVILVEIFLPSFNGFSGKSLQMDYFGNFMTLTVLLFLILVVGFFAGSYPAFYLSSFRPVKVLRGKTNSKSSWFRSSLVVFQFAVTIILFISTLVVYNQMKFVQEKNLGFNKENVLVIERAWSLGNHTQTFKDDILQNSNVISASNTNNLPGNVFEQAVFKSEDEPGSQQFPLALMAAGYEFDKTLGLSLSYGRYFSRDIKSDSSAIVLNENAVKLMNLKNPVGKRILLSGPNGNIPFIIIGVLKDFHFESLHQKIKPLAIFINKGQTSFLPVRIRSKNIPATISFIKEKWQKQVPSKPFEYYFLDENFNRLYQAEQKTGEIFTAFSFLALLIACLGLLGLTAFTIERKIKEISIRKVLGASIFTVVLIISNKFLKWVLISNFIAWPAAYFFMNNWLHNFAYRIEMSWWMFAVSGGTALLIALLTISVQAVKAATSNPIENLRYE